LILFLSICPKKHRRGFNRDTCTPLFTAALLTISKLWKQLWCPTTGEWIEKICFIYTAEYYSAIGKIACVF
jgi:hypothetical protein